MSDERGIGKISLLLILCLLIASRAVAGTVDERRASAVLLNQYETVFFTTEDMSSVFSGFKGLSRAAASALEIPFGYLPAGLDLLNKHASGEILGSADAVLMGAKDFIPPQGAGSAEHPRFFCFVVIFGKQSTPGMRKYFTTAPAASAAGGPVWKWEASLFEHEPAAMYYVAQVGRSYLVFSNDLKELQTTATRLTSSEDPSQTLSGIRDWGVINEHQYWGYRRYRRNGVLAKDAADLDKYMPGLEAIMFYADVKQKAGVVRLIGSKAADSAVAKMNQQFAAEPSGSAPSFKPSGEGVWGATISLSGGQMAMGRMWEILSYFGFTILI